MKDLYGFRGYPMSHKNKGKGTRCHIDWGTRCHVDNSEFPLAFPLGPLTRKAEKSLLVIPGLFLAVKPGVKIAFAGVHVQTRVNLPELLRGAFCKGRAWAGEG